MREHLSILQYKDVPDEDDDIIDLRDLEIVSNHGK